MGAQAGRRPAGSVSVKAGECGHMQSVRGVGGEVLGAKGLWTQRAVVGCPRHTLDELEASGAPHPDSAGPLGKDWQEPGTHEEARRDK